MGYFEINKLFLICLLFYCVKQDIFYHPKVPLFTFKPAISGMGLKENISVELI